MTNELRRLDRYNPVPLRFTRADDSPTQTIGNNQGDTNPTTTYSGPAYYPTAETARGARTVALNDPRMQQLQYRLQNSSFDGPTPETREGPDGAKILAAYDEHQAKGPPKRKDFPNRFEYEEALRAFADEGRELERQAIPYLLKRTEDFASTSPTGRAVVEQLKRQGGQVVVLPDAEYNAKFPGTGGVNADGKIYFPVSSINKTDDANVLVHEYGHAVFGDAMNLDRPQQERVEALRSQFEAIGLDPKDGELLAKYTEGWKSDGTPNGVDAQHVATSLIGHDLQREVAGLAKETGADREALVKRCAEHELALALTRKKDDPNSNYSDEQFVKDYLATPLGASNPPEGSSDPERAANLRAKLEQWTPDAYVNGVTASETLGHVAAPVPADPNQPPQRGPKFD